MQAVLSDEIILTFSHEFNAETYRVSFEFQVVICYVYTLAPLLFSNSKQETSSHFLASCLSPTAFLDQADIQILSLFFLKLDGSTIYRCLSIFLGFIFSSSLAFALTS